MTLTSLVVRGPFRGPSGYDHHVREFVRELHRQGVAIQLVDVPEWSAARLPEHMRDPLFESLSGPVDARTVLHFCMPHQVRPHAKRLNVNFTMFEANRVQPRWVAANRTHDLLIVPTNSSRRAWIASGFPPARVHLCPLGINADHFTGSARPLMLDREDGESLSSRRIRFLNVSELGPRKNLLGLLRVWLRATSREDNAVLILKLGSYAPGSLQLFHHQRQTLQRELGRSLDEAAPVHCIHNVFSDGDMPRLFASATHYISMSHGEGWDQAMVEAAASDLKLIAPNHSAYGAYLDPSCAALIASREVPARFDHGGWVGDLFNNTRWWEPDEEEAIRAVRAAIDGTATSLASPRERILRDFTWTHATRRLIEILEELDSPLRWSFFPRRRLYTSRSRARTRNQPASPPDERPS